MTVTTIDPHYIPIDLGEMIFLDKDSAQPLTGGLVYFYADNQRSNFKPMYQITGTEPAYTFTALPDNPLVLSSIGTFQDSLGNPIIPYYYPWALDENNVLQPDYYYIVVQNSGMVPQFAREAMPFIPGLSGPGPDSTNSTYTNQISNPEFSEVLFDTTSSTYTYNFGAGASQVVTIAPNWDIVVSCAGAATVTVAQSTPAGSAHIPGNPGTVLNITSGSVSRLFLRQRIFGTPALWSGENVASTFYAKNYSGSPATLNLLYSQSNGTVVNQQLASVTLAGGAAQATPGTILIPVSNSSDTFPNAYVDIFFDIPVGVQFDISCVMVTPTGANTVNSLIYEEASPYRQTDQLYHYEYPIVPVGTVIDFAGYAAPLHYLLCDGTNTYDRVQYQSLFRATTLLSPVTLASSNTYTDANASKLYVGQYLEGNGIPAATTISSITGTTIVISNAAIISATSTLTYFAFGPGDNTSHFAVPDLRGDVLAAVGGSLLGTAASGQDALGYSGGSATHAILYAEMPLHDHTGSTIASYTAAGSSRTALTSNSTTGPGTNPVSVAQAGGGILNTSGTPMTIVQPTSLLYKYIRYE